MISHLKSFKPLYIKIITLAVAVMSIFAVTEYMEKDVVICVDGKTSTVKTYSSTVKDLLDREGIKINKEDYINISVEEKLKENMEIVIRRAVPVTVYTYDKKIETKSACKTVKEVLNSLDIDVDSDDKVIPSLNESIKPDMEITVTTMDEIIKVEKQEIPYDTITKKNDNILKGKTIKVQEGKNGLKEIKIKEIYENGKLISKEVIQEEIKSEPVPQIVEEGTKQYLATSRGNLSYRKSLIMTATAYDLSYESTGKRPGDKGYGITATGTRARPGVVSVDPSVIPLGSKLYIESLDGTRDYGFAYAEDTGSAIKGNRIDLFFESHSDALRFGRRKVKVYILDN